MTVTEAKELLISGMNYAAYREADSSLFVSDRNRLFGADHYKLEPNTVPNDKPSPWGEGELFETKMAQLLEWALKIGNEADKYGQAIRLLSLGDHYLNRIIARVKQK
jgi:hypothetical protein